MTDRLILRVSDVAEYVDMHPNTIRLALEAGALHGSQKRSGCAWRVRRACVDSWLDGEPCEHQKKRKAA